MGASARLWQRVVVVLSGLMIFAVLLGGLAMVVGFRSEHYRTFESPDGRYRLVVYRKPTIFAAPGQGSDAPGRIELVDSAGRAINSMPIDMVQLATSPEWTRQRVSVKLLLDWELE